MTQNKLVTTLNSAIITLLLGWMFIFLDFIFACVTAILNKIFLSSKFSADIFLVPFASFCQHSQNSDKICFLSILFRFFSAFEMWKFQNELLKIALFCAWFAICLHKIVSSVFYSGYNTFTESRILNWKATSNFHCVLKFFYFAHCREKDTL